MHINQEAEHEIVKKKLRNTQEEWIPYFNNQGMGMISAPDIYGAAKQEHKELMKSLAEDFREDREITSTRINYEKNSLNAEITHNYGSTVVKPKSTKVKVPVYGGEEPREDQETEAYLQALFDTKDNINEIMRVLKRFDKDKKLYLWTPSQSSRANKQVRSGNLLFFHEWFYVNGGNWSDDYTGFSRGVDVKSAKQTAKSGVLK